MGLNQSYYYLMNDYLPVHYMLNELKNMIIICYFIITSSMHW